MSDPAKPIQPEAAQAQPGYQYGGGTPPPVPAQPTGGTPGWFKRHSTLLAMGFVTLLVLYGSLNSLRFTNDASRTTAKAMQQPGPRLTPRDTVAAVEAANRRAAELARQQEELRRQQKAREAETTAGQAAGAGAASVAPSGSGQLSEVEQVLQQIKAERAKQQYASLWSSPIVAVWTAKQEAKPEAQPGISATPTNALNTTQQPPTVDVNAAVTSDPNKKQFPYDESTGPYHVIQRSTLVGATLMNELDGEKGGPVVAQIDKDDPVYAKNTNVLLWPEGTIVAGMAQPVNAGNQRLLGVSFDRVTMPDGYAMSLQTTPGLSQQGQSGLTGEVNTHWASKLGWSLAVGAIQGLSSGAFGLGTSSNSTVIFRSAGQDMSQLFQGILNRPSSIKIPAGTRIKIILLDDLNGVPEYEHHQMKPGVL